jgi:hypothetical protein
MTGSSMASGCDVTESDVTGIIRPKVGTPPWRVILFVRGVVVMMSLPVTLLHVALFPVRASSGDVTSSNACVMARSPLLTTNYALSYPDILLWYLDLGEHPINNPSKIYQVRQNSCPLGASVKGIARAFNWLKCLCGIMHLKPTAGCQISTLIFQKICGGGSLLDMHRVPPNPNIKVDIWHPAVGLRCIIPPRYLPQLKARAIPLT